MSKIIKKESTINIESIQTEDEKYRFVLTKSWDDSKKIATAIGINPSKANDLKGDNTSTNIMNYLIEHDYGCMKLVNLFPLMSPKTTGITKSKAYNKENLEHIRRCCSSSNIILIVWGYEKKYIKQKKEIESILRECGKEVMCFRDKQGNQPLHLRIYKDEYKLVKYKFL